MANQTAQFINPTRESDVMISHGDLCFSNILFDTRVESIKCIDPRGITPKGEYSIYGDRRYDLAKLYHSVVGLYDFIIAGRYSLDLNETTIELEAEKNKGYYQILINIYRSIKKIIKKFLKNIMKEIDLF